MIDFFDKIKSFIKELDTAEITEFKIVKNRYFKYKIGGKWHKNEIVNFDRYREASYKVLESILKNLFEKVEYFQQDVPVICVKNEILHYIPRLVCNKKVYFKERVLIATKLLPIFLKRYPKLDINSSTFLAFHLGGGGMLFHYEDTSPEEDYSSHRLVNDIGKLHRYAFQNKLSEAEISELIRDYYKDLFPRVLFLPQPTIPKSSEEVLKIPEKEEKVEVIKKISKPKKSKPKRISRDLKEEIHSFEKSKEIPYEEVLKLVEKYNPPTNDFFGRVAKIEYENKLVKIKNGEKRKEVDYWLYWFILASEKAKNKAEICKKFCEEIRKI